MSAISWVACPVEWRHAIDHTTFVCLDCGAEAVEMEPEEVRQIFNESSKPENLTPNADSNPQQ